MKKNIFIIFVACLVFVIFLYNSPLELKYNKIELKKIVQQNNITINNKLELFENEIKMSSSNYKNNFINSYYIKNNRLTDLMKEKLNKLYKTKKILPLTSDTQAFNNTIDAYILDTKTSLNELYRFDQLIKTFDKHKSQADQANFVQLQYIINDFRLKEQLKPKPIIRTLNNKKIYLSYLTFDDGPSENTSKIIERLNKWHVDGTFFIVGSEAAKLNKNKYLKELINSGHSIGLHGYSHNYEKTNNRLALKNELIKTNKLLNKYKYNTKLFRSPYGSLTLNKKDRDFFIKENYYLWDWNIDSLDWRDKKNSKKVNRRLEKQISYLKNKKDLIILYHEYDSTIESIDKTIKLLQKNGYYIVKMNPELFYSNYFEKPNN